MARTCPSIRKWRPTIRSSVKLYVASFDDFVQFKRRRRMSPIVKVFGCRPAMSDLSPQCATKRTSIIVIDLSVHLLALSACDALARARPVGEPCVARAIGQACERRIAAKTEIRRARG